jgi:hypothetical protein
MKVVISIYQDYKTYYPDFSTAGRGLTWKIISEDRRKRMDRSPSM